MKILLSKPHAIAFWQCSIGNEPYLLEFAKYLRSQVPINRGNSGAQSGCDASHLYDGSPAIKLLQIHFESHDLLYPLDEFCGFVKCPQEFRSSLHVFCSVEDVCGKY